MSKYMSDFKQGIVRGLGFLAAVFLGGAVVLYAQSMHTFQSNTIVSAAQINANFQIAAPVGAVVAFNLMSCPAGWTAADGTNGTPDLRGVFVRGRNNFGSAAGTRADGNEDPDGLRAPASLQQDAFQGHVHDLDSAMHAKLPAGITGQGGAGLNIDTGPNTGTPLTDGANGTPRTADETRPRNVALTYCVRIN